VALPGNTELEVYRRDKFKCQCCNYDGRASFEAWRRCLCIDHFIPRRYGGTDEMYNLKTACHVCNSDKGSHKFDSLDEARLWLRLYREEVAIPWYQSFVLNDEDPTTKEAKQKISQNLKRQSERFMEEKAKLLARSD
jgi:hypothetical protein